MITTTRWVHRLTEIDPENRTAVCLNCGPVKVQPNGKPNQYVCTVARNERRKKSANDQLPHGRARRRADHYDDLMVQQGGMCAICGNDQVALHVDHDHMTKVVRGLLCAKCNQGIGFFLDDPNFTQQAATYLFLNQPPKPHCVGCNCTDKDT